MLRQPTAWDGNLNVIKAEEEASITTQDCSSWKSPLLRDMQVSGEQNSDRNGQKLHAPGYKRHLSPGNGNFLQPQSKNLQKESPVSPLRCPVTFRASSPENVGPETRNTGESNNETHLSENSTSTSTHHVQHLQTHERKKRFLDAYVTASISDYVILYTPLTAKPSKILKKGPLLHEIINSCLEMPLLSRPRGLKEAEAPGPFLNWKCLLSFGGFARSLLGVLQGQCELCSEIPLLQA